LKVDGDYLIPLHCEDYAEKFGDYWGQPCKLSYDRASSQLLWVDSQHNDTNSTCNYLGCNGVGYMSAPLKFVAIGVKAYQGRLRYRYNKVYPVEDDELERAFKDTKDDILLVGKYQVLGFES